MKNRLLTNPIYCNIVTHTHLQQSPDARHQEKPHMYKTVLCHQYEATGNCMYNNKFRYAHRQDEL